MQRHRSLSPCALAFVILFLKKNVVKTLFFLQQVCSLERMLRVKTRTEEEAKIAGAAATAGATAGTIGLLEVHEAEPSEVARTAGAAATTGESVGIIGLRQVMESDVARPSLIHESSLARSCADVGAFGAGVSVSGSAAPCVAALPADRALTYARVAANACGEVASACNSGSFGHGEFAEGSALDELQPPRGCGSKFTQKSATKLHGWEQVC